MLNTSGSDAVTNETSRALAHRLRAETEGEVLFDDGARGRYATDASIYQVMPVGVLVPKTARDVAVAIDIAHDLKVPVLPRGAGTSQCGQTVGAALVIDNSKYRRAILEIDAANATAKVEPGLVLDHLNAALRKHGLWYPVDVSTSAQATLGGMAGNNSCGSRSITYGNMVHNVLGATAWLSDGEEVAFGPVSALHGRGVKIAEFVRGLALANKDEIQTNWPKVLRRVAGYNLDIFDNQNERPYTKDGTVNLAHLLVGSEGTLAFTKDLTLKLSPLPGAKVLGVVNFTSFHAAMDSAQHIVTLGPSAVELVDRIMIELALSNPAFRTTMQTALIERPQAILLVEFAGHDKAVLAKQLKSLVALMGDLGQPGSVVEMVDDALQKNLWEVRKAGLNIMMSLKGDGKPVSFIEDCAVPLRHLADYTAALTEVFARHGTHGTWYAHASVGTLHVRPILDMRRGDAAKMRAIAEEASELVRKYKGAFSGEHGDGLCRGEWIGWQFGPRINEAFRAIKQELDPAGLFAPNRIIDPPKMDNGALFRFPPTGAPLPYTVRALDTALDWSDWDVQNDPVTEQISASGTGGDPAHGFAKAAEMCNNNGHCRKFDAGVMCPSYRVTRDERHVTRGRANTLRLALSGQLGPDALTGPALAETMSLCVSCKGCKRECPTGVDMARMKIEFLSHYKTKHGFTLRDRLVAGLPRYAPLAARLAPLLNLRNRIGALRWLSEKLAGLSAARDLPRWRRDRFDHAGEAFGPEDGPEVVLWADSFNAAFEPGILRDALTVLTAAGYRVHLAQAADTRPLCCGRTFLAVGDVDNARVEMTRSLAALAPFFARGVPMVGLEPSCLYTFRDEALVLLPGADSKRAAASALLLEEFIAREAKAGRFKASFKPAMQKTLLHGHCHQKAFGAMGAVEETLRLIPGLILNTIESGCCGMAGAFGYQAETSDVSRAMGELSLLPAAREAGGDTVLVADGTSCRHQIAGGSSREAIHVASFLERHLK